jgi:hypothetical protein
MTLTPTILQKSKPNRLDSVWYTGEILEVKYKGYTFYAWEAGDVRVENKNNDNLEITNYKSSDRVWWSENGGRTRALSDTDLTDEDLGKDEWNWCMNNWFEISARDKDGQFIDLMESTGSWDEAYDYLSDESILDQHVDNLMSDAERKRIAKGGVIKQ